MCKKIVNNILGKDVSSKNRYDEHEWKESQYAMTGKGDKVTYLQKKKSKKTPLDVVENINKKFKTN